MSLTKDQRKAALILGVWMISVLKLPPPQARIEVSQLLSKYSAKKLLWVSSQTNCTSLDNLKAILENTGRNA